MLAEHVVFTFIVNFSLVWSSNLLRCIGFPLSPVTTQVGHPTYVLIDIVGTDHVHDLTSVFLRVFVFEFS